MLNLPEPSGSRTETAATPSATTIREDLRDLRGIHRSQTCSLLNIWTILFFKATISYSSREWPGQNLKMARKAKSRLNAASFLKQAGPGRSIRVYRNKEVVYLQGSSAN